MKIRFIKDFHGIRKGTECDISEHYGTQHIKSGNAVEVTDDGEAENVSRETITTTGTTETIPTPTTTKSKKRKSK